MHDISQFLQHFSYIGLFILLILGGIGFPFPEDVILIMAGFSIAHNVMEPVPAILIIYSGLLLTDYFLYSMGKKFGRMIVTHKKFHTILSPEKLSHLEATFKQKGSLLLIVGRHIAGLRAQLFLVAGVMKMPAVKFLAVDGITSIITITLMVGAGYLGGNSLQVIEKDISRVEHLGIVLLILFLTIYIIYRYYRNRGDKTIPRA